jgi:hypothetical protein
VQLLNALLEGLLAPLVPQHLVLNRQLTLLRLLHRPVDSQWVRQWVRDLKVAADVVTTAAVTAKPSVTLDVVK